VVDENHIDKAISASKGDTDAVFVPATAVTVSCTKVDTHWPLLIMIFLLLK